MFVVSRVDLLFAANIFFIFFGHDLFLGWDKFQDSTHLPAKFSSFPRGPQRLVISMPWMKSPVWLARQTRAWRHPLSMNGRRSMGHNWDAWLNEFVDVKHGWGWKIQDE